MSDPTNPTLDAIRRLKASIGAASSLNEVMTAVQVALGAFFSLEQMHPTLVSRGGNQSAYASLPGWGSHKWITDPVSAPAALRGAQDSRSGDAANPHARRNLLRTGELFLEECEEEASAPEDATQPLGAVPIPLGAYVLETVQEEADARARWRATTQLMTLLLAGQEPTQFLPSALRLSIHTFGVSGALIHLDDDDIVPGERWFSLGEPGFEAALRATARQRRGLTSVEPSTTLAGRYPHRLIVPIRSARGELGKYALFRADAPDFDADDREDASAIATLLAVALHQYRQARA